MSLIAQITNISRASLHDGPGIRTTVFMKGCDLKCYWCHNPEAMNKEKTIAFHSHKCIGCKECLKVCPNAKKDKVAFFFGECEKCGKCAAACPTGAVTLRKNGTPRPVKTALCIGCGACQKVCPAEKKAMRVYPVEKQSKLQEMV